MKSIHVFLLLTCGFSHLSLAQQLTSGNIINSVDSLNRQVSDITQSATRHLNTPPFSLSELPKVEDTVTLPLNTLAPELEITGLNGRLIYKEVEVEGGWRAIKGQWVVIADDVSVRALTQAGANIVATKSYGALGLSLLHFVAPPELDSKTALLKILPSGSAKTLDRNHVFSAQTASSAPLIPSGLTTFTPNSACLDKVNIGMVDSNIELNHQAFSGASIVLENIVSTEVKTPLRHGTALASLLLGNGASLNPLLPNGNLYLASVFHRQSDFAQGATTVNIIEGLNWLASKKLNVINMSLAGPNNQILALALESLAQSNIIVVAAAGNEGPLAEPLYPAAYEHVIAVSATDNKNHIYRWANRGEHIDFAALGVNVTTAQPGNGFGLESGTSMASPVIAALIACQAKHSAHNLDSIKQILRAKAIDLGESGKDSVFGYGLVTPP